MNNSSVTAMSLLTLSILNNYKFFFEEDESVNIKLDTFTYRDIDRRN